MTARIATCGMALLFGMSAAPALATDTTVTGRKLLIKDFTRPGQADRKVVFVSRDPIVVPAAPGSAGDPTLNGGSLDVHNTAGSGDSTTLALPAGNWVLKGDDVYLYRELVKNPPTQEYRIKVIVRSGHVRGFVRDERGSLISYTLDEPTQGSVGVRVATGADRHCLDFGGIVVADTLAFAGSAYRGRFIAKDAPAPATCD